MKEDQLKKLDNYDKMYQAVQLGYQDASKQMEALKLKGKARSATYKQLMVQKMTYQNMITMYKLFGIDS